MITSSSLLPFPQLRPCGLPHLNKCHSFIHSLATAEICTNSVCVTSTVGRFIIEPLTRSVRRGTHRNCRRREFGSVRQLGSVISLQPSRGQLCLYKTRTSRHLLKPKLRLTAIKTSVNEQPSHAEGNEVSTRDEEVVSYLSQQKNQDAKCLCQCPFKRWGRNFASK